MKKQVIKGKIQGNERGYAFLLPLETTQEDYFIPHSDLKGAMHGDIVLAETVETGGDNRRTTARVLKIIERGIKEIVGTYFTCRTGGFVVPDEKKYFTDIFIPFGKGLKAKAGDKVVAKILAYPKKKSPEGIVSKIFGKQFNKKAELESIIYSYNLPQKFKKATLDEQDFLSETIDKKEYKNRLDLRKENIFTIDGIDARDFDDAVNVKILENGNYLLGVHIADVTYYVKENSHIDKEAFERATSVYFPELVLPMLPEKLCNNLCSLVEGKDRLTLSCIMEIDSNGNVVDTKIVQSIINSKKRCTYEGVQKALDGIESAIKEYESVYKDLLLMNKLADILTEKRNKNGNINLDVKESIIYVDDSGKIHISATSSIKSRKIIEEFMIVCNCAVAEFCGYQEIPFIYRIHEEPSPEKVKTFFEFLNSIGIRYRGQKDKVYSKDFQSILESVENTPNYTLINRVMLRSMQKAKYSPENKGHFGLSEKMYCHFTSPIRRYPDLSIHRIIKDMLSGKVNLEKKYGESVYINANQSSERERVAIEAERAVDEYYKMLYIENYIGEEFEGIVSGMVSSGIFVELENGVEGFVDFENERIKTSFDKAKFSFTAGKKTYKLGEKVKIKVDEVDIINKRARFILLK